MQPDKFTYNAEAEQQIIGSLLVSPELYATVVGDIIQTGHFYLLEHQVIFDVITGLINAGKPVDMVMVYSALENNGDLESAGGGSYLSNCLAVTTSTANIEAHCELVIKAAQRRELQKLSQWLSAQAGTGGIDAGEVIDETLAKLHAIGLYGISGSNLKSIAEIAPDVMKVVDELQTETGETDFIPFGYSNIDNKVGGVLPGMLVVLAGRPGMGKTALGLNVAYNISQTGKRVLFSSIEMTERELGMRLMKIASGVDMSPLRRKGERLSIDAMRKLATALSCLTDTPLWIDDNANIGLSNIRSQLHRLKIKKTPVEVLFVDYLGIMRMGKEENQNLRIASVTRGLKVIAKEFKISVVVMAQLSRENVKGTVRPPVLSDLRDSGAIEQDADMVIFIHRPGEYDKTNHELKNLAQVEVAKARDTPTGVFKLNFFGQNQRFEMRSETKDEDIPLF